MYLPPSPPLPLSGLRDGGGICPLGRTHGVTHIHILIIYSLFFFFFEFFKDWALTTRLDPHYPYVLRSEGEGGGEGIWHAAITPGQPMYIGENIWHVSQEL